MFPGGRSLLEEHLSASSPSSHSVESINRKQPSDLSDPASYHLRVSMQKHTNLNWKGREGGRATSVEVSAALHLASFHPLLVPHFHLAGETNDPIKPRLPFPSPPRIFTPWLWTNSYYSITISSMNRFQPISLYSMVNILLYFIIFFLLLYFLEVRMNDIAFNRVYKSCLPFQFYMYINLPFFELYVFDIKFHGIWLEEKRFYVESWKKIVCSILFRNISSSYGRS